MRWKFWLRQQSHGPESTQTVPQSVFVVAVLVVSYPALKFLVSRLHPAASEIVILVAGLLIVALMMARAATANEKAVHCAVRLWVTGVLLETIAITLDRAVGDTTWIVWVMAVLVMSVLLMDRRDA